MDGVVTERTRLAMIDTVTSPTGLLMPYERMVAQLEERGVHVLLDAAHGIGMIPLNLDELGASYTSNCHKWLCAPKGSAFLHVRKDRQASIHPLTISHGMTFPLGDTTASATSLTGPAPETCRPTAHCRSPSTTLPTKWRADGPPSCSTITTSPCVVKHPLCESLGLVPPCPDEMVACIATSSCPKPTARAGFRCTSPTRFTRFSATSTGSNSGLVVGLPRRAIHPNLCSTLQHRRKVPLPSWALQHELGLGDATSN